MEPVQVPIGTGSSSGATSHFHNFIYDIPVIV